MDTIKIHIDTNAEQASKSFEDLSKSFNKANDGAIDLRKEIKGLKDELYKLTPGTEEYGRVLQELGGKMDQLSDTSQELRVATGGLDAVFQSTTNATATMAAGFTAATGVVALFGGDTENLQKTFVKLQAVMAITTGLKGFAAFGKETKKASTSLKAFINQMRLARTATQQQTTATATLTTTENVASTATKGLGAAFKSLTAAIASNPIGAILVALTAAVTAISHFTNKAKEAAEQTKRWNDVLNELKGSQYTYSNILEQNEVQFNKEIAAMKALGASQESIDAKTLKYAKTRREQMQADLEYYEHLIDVNKANKDLNDKLEEWADKARECTAEIKQLDATIQALSYTLPTFATAFDKAFSDFDRDLSRKVARGVMSERGKVVEEIGFYNDEINKLENTINKFNRELGKVYNYDENGKPDYSEVNKNLSEKQKKEMEKDVLEMQSRLELYKGQVEVFTKTLEDIDDKNAKTLSDKRAATMKTSQDELQRLIEDLEKKWGKMSKEVTETLDVKKVLKDALGSDTDPRMYGILIEMKQRFEKELNDMQTSAKKNNKILASDYNSFVNTLLKYYNMIDDLYEENGIDYDEWPVSITSMSRNLDSISDMFVKENNIMLEQVKLGTVKIDEYNSWLETRMSYYQDERNKSIMEGYNLIDYELEHMEVSDEQKEQFRSMWVELFNFSGELLPPEESKKISDALWDALNKALTKTDEDFDKVLNKMKTDVNMAANSWIRGRSDGGIITTLIFGAGEDPTKVYNRAQKQAQDIYNTLYQQYTQEIEMATKKAEIIKAVYGEESAEYKKYADEITRLQALLTQAQINYEAEQVENAEDYAEKIKGATTSTFDTISGLASAMGSYYHEQAEQARDANGELTEESKKYLQKEGAMKIHQVWADFASGVMATWAGYSDFGPLTYVLAGIQTAALLATAIASTQQINRETKANVSGGPSTANVGQLTDRVIMAEAQNTEQTAQLNAQYNQGNMRVYVTQNDIENANNENRVAVTSNKF